MTAQDDQVTAAIRESRLLMQSLAESFEAPIADADDRARRLLLERFPRFLKGCPHLVGPQPIFAFLAVPERVFCEGCFLPLGRELSATDTCDMCGRRAERFRPVTFSAPPLTVFGWSCSNCPGDGIACE